MEPTRALRGEPETRGATPRAGLGHRHPCPAREESKRGAVDEHETMALRARHHAEAGPRRLMRACMRGRARLGAPGSSRAFHNQCIPRRPAERNEKRTIGIVRGSRGSSIKCEPPPGIRMERHGRAWTSQAVPHPPSTSWTTHAHLERAQVSSSKALPRGSTLLQNIAAWCLPRLTTAARSIAADM